MSQQQATSKADAPLQVDASRRRSPVHQGCHILSQLLFYGLSLYFFGYLSIYYFTGAGGATLLAVTMVPIAVAIAFINDLRHDNLYPLLSPLIATLIGIVYAGALVYASPGHRVRADPRLPGGVLE